MEAVNKINNPNLKLIIFGSVIPELKEKFDRHLSKNIQYAGWIPGDNAYEFFSAADLVVFPGLHSVFWEQAIGLGKPCIFRYMEGFTHIDLDGNCKFLYNDSIDELIRVITPIFTDLELFENMKKVASTLGREHFSYEKIAKRSISI